MKLTGLNEKNEQPIYGKLVEMIDTGYEMFIYCKWIEEKYQDLLEDAYIESI